MLVAGIILGRTVANIGKLQKGYQRAVLLESAFYAAEDLIAETAAVPEPNPGRLEPVFHHDVRLVDVEFAHDKTPVLHGVSLVIPVGALTVLTGPSGSGKTT